MLTYKTAFVPLIHFGLPFGLQPADGIGGKAGGIFAQKGF